MQRMDVAYMSILLVRALVKECPLILHKHGDPALITKGDFSHERWKLLPVFEFELILILYSSFFPQ